MGGTIIGLEVELGSIPQNRVQLHQFLTNGGSLYTDVGNHLEYCTPEVASALDALVFYNAGDLVVERRLRSFRLKRLIKNNTDGRETHGCHESYLMKRVSPSVYEDRVAYLMIPHLVTRQLYAGAGRVQRHYPHFTLSQRAPFIQKSVSMATTRERAIFNLKDEPLADGERFTRMHLIVGDSNRSQVSTYLKVGTTELVVRLAEEGVIPFLYLQDPVRDFNALSSDTRLNWVITLSDGRTMPAIDVQREYLLRATRYRGRDAVTDDILVRWEATLDKLEKKDPVGNLSRELDWVIKLRKCLELRNEERIGWRDSRVRDLDLLYHEVGENSMFRAWEQSGEIETVAFDEDIRRAADNPPQNTRARARGIWVQRYGHMGNKLWDAWRRRWDILPTFEPMGEFNISNPLDNYKSIVGDEPVEQAG